MKIILRVVGFSSNFTLNTSLHFIGIVCCGEKGLSGYQVHKDIRATAIGEELVRTREVTNAANS